jgi:AcrR family transcriptional regulator
LRINPEKKEERERVALSLLRATLELAAAHGFSSLGLREVSRAAGIAPTSFYRHFADMEELGLALIESLVGRLVGELSNAEGLAHDGLLEAFVNRAFAAAAADPELFRFVLAERVGSIGSFREALALRLGVISHALRATTTSERALAPVAATPRDADADADAVVLLVFDACGKMLDRGREHLPALAEQLRRQARLLLSPPTEASSHR